MNLTNKTTEELKDMKIQIENELEQLKAKLQSKGIDLDKIIEMEKRKSQKTACEV